MTSYITIKNLNLVRAVSRIFPLKHKLNFLISKYLKTGTQLAIGYYKTMSICTTLNDENRSTVAEVILRGPDGQPEAALLKKIKKDLPNNTVFADVGGNIGTFFWQFRDKCKDIYVFEPIPRLNDVIERSIKYNNDEHVHLIKKAVGDKPGQVKMLDNNNSSVVGDDNNAAVLTIPVTTLDDELLSLEKLDFIKIDVEGYELLVLNGAKRVIEKYRPAMLVELHPMYLENYGQSHVEVIEFIEGCNYKISYFSFLAEQRMSRISRILSRWGGNKGESFESKEAFLKDIYKEPRLGTYHLYCERK
jgi:FkbM family methyltransferase